MGAMTRMREASPWLLGFIAICFIGFMIMSDVIGDGSIMRGGVSEGDPIGSVNGEDIPFKEFEARVKEQLDYQQQQAMQTGQEVDDAIIRQAVWDQMVEEVLLRQTAQKAGITVSDAELQDVLLENPPEYVRRQFTDPQTQQFDRRRYLEIVTNPDRIRTLIDARSGVDANKAVSDFKNYIIRVQDAILQQRLSESVRTLAGTAAGISSPLYLEQQYVTDNSSAEVNFVLFDVNKVDEKNINISDSEIQEYYNKHKESFKQKNARKLKYVTFPLEPSKLDSNLAKTKINRIRTSLENAGTPEQKSIEFDKFVAEFGGKTNDYTLVSQADPQKLPHIANLQKNDVAGPVELPTGTYFFRMDDRRSGQQEVVKASHILINFGNNKDSAKAEANKILARAKKGEEFGMLASEFSQDKGSAVQGGDLGFFPKGQMVKPFEEAAFAAAPGSIVGPVESQFGYHIINVKEKVSDEIKFSEIEINLGLTNATKNALYRDALSFKSAVESGKNFDTLARQLKKNAVETVFFENTGPVLGSRAITDFAFDNQVGTVSNPIELKHYGIVIAQVTGTRQPGIRPLEDMKEEVKSRLAKIKKLDYLKSKAQEVYSKVQNFDILARVAEVDPTLEVRTASGTKNNGQVQGIGNDFAFTSAAYIAPVGKIYGPVRGERGYYILQVTNRTMADPSKMKADFSNMYKQAKNNVQMSVYNQWFTTIKEKADIEDNRSKFYKSY
ncbi:MAG TPA: peptidylprolyl isomerase [Patescibacteria group bacterium]|nr:peptidylprolyl isomerase [Patescibacteria group bacterium]